MITLQSLMRKNKAELRKMLRETGRAANARLAEYYDTKTIDNLTAENRELIQNYTRENRGRFYTAPRAKKDRPLTKRFLALQILHAREVLKMPDPKELANKERLQDIEKHKYFWIDQIFGSEFWKVYNNYVYDQKWDEEEALNLARSVFKNSGIDLFTRFEGMTKDEQEAEISHLEKSGELTDKRLSQYLDSYTYGKWLTGV